MTRRLIVDLNGYQQLAPDCRWQGRGLRPHLPVLYTCENRRGEILYVGQTRDWWERRSAHSTSSDWWPQVRVVHVLRMEWPDQRRAEEAALLRILQPPHNINGTLRDPRLLKRALAATERLRASA